MTGEALTELERLHPFAVRLAGFADLRNLIGSECEQCPVDEEELFAVLAVAEYQVFTGHLLEHAQVVDLGCTQISRSVEHLPVHVGRCEALLVERMKRYA